MGGIPTRRDRDEPPGGPAALARVALVAAGDRSLARNRDGLIRDLVARRHAVLCVAPEFGPDERRALNLMGAETVPFRAPPVRFKVFAERSATAALAALLKDWRADRVMGMGGAAMAEAMLAAEAARIRRRVALLNVPLDAPGADGRPLARQRLERALSAAHVVVAHNAEIARAASALIGGGGASRAPRPEVVVVDGAGVDLVHHAPKPLPGLDDGLVFLMIAPVARSRGVIEFCSAARMVAARASRARFVLAGPPGTGADALAEGDLRGFADVVEMPGAVEDVRPLIARAHVVVQPTHGEGLPRTLIEALAAGRPVIATDTPGCRVAVDERVNGCLVAPRDATALALAIESFLKRPDLIPSMARASRLKAERRFDMGAVNARLLAALDIAADPVPAAAADHAAATSGGAGGGRLSAAGEAPAV